MGGPNDKALCEQIISESTKEVRSLAGELSIMQSVAFMKNAKRNFVNDSGPLHFASAVNAPVTAFFCSTIPAFGFGPLSDDAKIIEVAGLPCRPCGLHGHKTCPEGHFKCGELALED
jgi:heptosyltransferase-2